MEGAIYFEMKINKGCKGFKIGLTKSVDFDLDKSFCDYETGYAFFSKGQLRHDSDSMGKNF
jgi:hypothetical protein